MTYREKKHIAQMMDILIARYPKRLQDFKNILKSETAYPFPQNVLQGKEDFEIDFERLSTRTLRRLQELLFLNDL